MPYREPDIIPLGNFSPDKSINPPFWIRWFTNPWTNLKAISDTDPVCIEDGWGRRWYERDDNWWVSMSPPYWIGRHSSRKQFESLIGCVVAYRASIGKKIKSKPGE